jgi:hypothetical protein
VRAFPSTRSRVADVKPDYDLLHKQAEPVPGPLKHYSLSEYIYCSEKRVVGFRSMQSSEYPWFKSDWLVAMTTITP